MIRHTRLMKVLSNVLASSCSGDAEITGKTFLNATINDKTKFKLYGDTASPPVRFAMMTAHILGVDLQYQHLDLFKGDNKTKEFKKINSLQKVPTLIVDNKYIIADSNAIALFLASNFDKHGVLYPDNQFIRAKIHESMFYNSGVLFPIDSAIYTSYFENIWPVEKLKKDWYRALEHLNNQLKRSTHLVGDKLTLADLCTATTVSSAELILPLRNEFKPINDWLTRLQDLPCFKLNETGLQRLQCKIKQREDCVLQSQFKKKTSIGSSRLT